MGGPAQMRRGFVLTPDGDAATLPRLSPFLRRKRIGAGVSHGLQIRWRYARVCRGGFDSHTLPPDDREVWRAAREDRNSKLHFWLPCGQYCGPTAPDVSTLAPREQGRK